MANILDTIGNTPLIELNRFIDDSRFRLFAKLEGFNPGGSIKDRPALAILKEALDTHIIRPGSVVVESSSGNMGIGLAQACRYMGLKLICVIDPKVTTQNRKLLLAYGAELSMVEIADPVTGEYLPARLRRVKELLIEHKASFWPNQYGNKIASRAHYRTMAEILSDMDDRVDYLFCPTSTCGTLRGCAEFLNAHSPSTRVIAVDAVGSVIFGSPSGKRVIPGIGASIVPDLFEGNLANRCVQITDFESVIGCRRLLRDEALLVGGSSGAVAMAVEQIQREIPDNARCVAIFPDRGERYIDTIFSDSWVNATFQSH